jgi:hypothetical protein
MPHNFITLEELKQGVPEIRQAPSDKGVINMIIIRPQSNMRKNLSECIVSVKGGIVGDRWGKSQTLLTSLGSRNPGLKISTIGKRIISFIRQFPAMLLRHRNYDRQISIMNTRAISLIEPDKERWPLTGDNFIIDMDISYSNLHSGQKLAIGEAIIEITPLLHTSCGKFEQRFGKDARAFVNSSIGLNLRLRGVLAKVIKPGNIRVGDIVTKINS